jgi:hypothetical protein
MARDTASAFLRTAEHEEAPSETAVARRLLGVSCFMTGEFSAAREHLTWALIDSHSERDIEARFRFGSDTAAHTAAFLAFVNWHLGEVERAREFERDATQRIIELGPVLNYLIPKGRLA